MILTALLLAAAQPAATPGWMVGIWIPVTDASSQDAAACQSDEAVRYWPDGRYADLWTVGAWGLRGGRLRLTVTDVTEAGDGLPGDYGPTVSRVERLGQNRARLTDTGSGEVTLLLRCPEPQ